MTLTHIDHMDTGMIRADLGRLRIWGAQDLNVAVVYGAVSTEDALYIAKSPVERLFLLSLRRLH
ncbi:hypothetical protein ACFC0P_47000, partial [Streptomyces broussonetiae]